MKMLKYIRLLLLPIALLYGIIIRVRNFLFNIEKIKFKHFDLPIISVGNITVGGTGKTPLTEFIIRILKDNNKVALLSRGYKRETQGVIIANETSTATEIGDEPKQILDKFSNLTVVVAEKRVEGINRLLELKMVPDVVVMDDAYQHRYLKPGLSVLVVDYNRPLWNDLMLPAGELREPMSGKKRADIILFSKCPQDMSKHEQERFIGKIKPSPNQPVYFSTVGYKSVESVFSAGHNLESTELNSASVLVVTGIANPLPFVDHVNTLVNKVYTIRFSDHYQFTESDIEKIHQEFNKIEGDNKLVLTTEKDAVRFKQVVPHESDLVRSLYYIPIEIKILNEQQEEFKEKIITYVKQNKRNR